MTNNQLVKVPTLADARKYLEQFQGHGVILDRFGNIVSRCRCMHGPNQTVQVTGRLIKTFDKYGMPHYEDVDGQ